MNSKIEKILLGVLWYLNLIGLRLIMPIQEIDYKITAQFILASFVPTTLELFIYLKLRNNIILKNIARYHKNNEFDACLSYLDKKIVQYKKTEWIKHERVLTLAMKGDVLEFRAAAEKTKQEPHKASIRLEIIEKFIFLYQILFDDSTKSTGAYSKTNLTIDNLINLLVNRKNMQSNEVVSTALLIYNSETFLYKSIAAKILYEEYLEKDINTAQLYLSKAKELAPSPDILNWINRAEKTR